MHHKPLTIHKPAGSRLAASIILPLLLPVALLSQFLLDGNLDNALLRVAERGGLAVVIFWFGVLVLVPFTVFFWMIPAMIVWQRGYVYIEQPDSVVTTGRRSFSLHAIDRFEHITFPRKQLKIFLTDGRAVKIESFLLVKENPELEQNLKAAIRKLN